MGNGEIARNEQFLLSHSIFYLLENPFPISSYLELSSSALSFWKSLKFVVRKRVNTDNVFLATAEPLNNHPEVKMRVNRPSAYLKVLVINKMLNSLQVITSFESSRLKELVEDESNEGFIFVRVENILGKWRKGWLQIFFSIFP